MIGTNGPPAGARMDAMMAVPDSGPLVSPLLLDDLGLSMALGIVPPQPGMEDHYTSCVDALRNLNVNAPLLGLACQDKFGLDPTHLIELLSLLQAPDPLQSVVDRLESEVAEAREEADVVADRLRSCIAKNHALRAALSGDGAVLAMPASL